VEAPELVADEEAVVEAARLAEAAALPGLAQARAADLEGARRLPFQQSAPVRTA